MSAGAKRFDPNAGMLAKDDEPAGVPKLVLGSAAVVCCFIRWAHAFYTDVGSFPFPFQRQQYPISLFGDGMLEVAGVPQRQPWQNLLMLESRLPV